MTAIPGQSFTLTPATRILVGSDSPGVMGATVLAEILRLSTGYPFPVSRQGDQPSAQSIQLKLVDSAELGGEGYRLDVASGAVILRANTAAGLFYSVETLRQLLPSQVESDTV